MFADRLVNLEKKGKSKANTHSCRECNKTFTTQSIYEDHINSNKHKKKLKSFEVEHENILQKEALPIEREERDLAVVVKDSHGRRDDAEKLIVDNQCLVCLYESESLDMNLEHMSSFHFSFMLDNEFCSRERSNPEDSKIKQLTCSACRIQLRDDKSFRAHYRTEWHSQNLKRKLVDLPPLTPREYLLKDNKLKKKQIGDKSENVRYGCHKCNKTFTSKSTYESHVNSKKHKKNMVQKETLPTKEEESDLETDECSEAENPLVEHQCFFCSHESTTFYKNFKHMTSFHSFVIPDIEYCTDIRGLLLYLGEKVTKDYMCLWCNKEGLYSIGAVKSHMVDKGHCRMQFTERTEYADFYDYSPYPDVDKDDDISVGVMNDIGYELVLPSGIKVGHRSLMRYYKQKTSRQSALVPFENPRNLQNIFSTVFVVATISDLGWSKIEQEVAVRKTRDVNFSKKLQSKWHTEAGVRNNKFQRHFRPQVEY